MKCTRSIKPITIGCLLHDQGPQPGLRQKGLFKNFLAVFPISYAELEARIAPTMHLGRQIGTEQSTSTLGDFRAMHKWQS